MQLYLLLLRQYDITITGKGENVYFGCGITSKNGKNFITYNIKEIEIKFDFIFLLKMFGFAIGVNFGALCIVACCRRCCCKK